jgi:hypothetical protein
MPIANFDKVELLLPMTGANNGTTFTDYSLRRRVISRYGDSKTSTAQSKFAAYGSSGLFDGTGDTLETPLGAIGTKIRSAPFCFEGWFRPANVSGTKSLINCVNVTGKANNGTNDLTTNDGSAQGNFFISDNVPGFFRATGATTGASILSSVTVSANTWAHLALTWDQTTLRIFVDGVLGVSDTTWHDYTTPTLAQVYAICGWFNGTNRNNQNFNGHVQDLCITIGAAKYTTNFTPPARMTQRTLTRANTGTDSHEYDRAVLFDWNGEGGQGKAVTPDNDGNFEATDLIDLEYGVAFIKDGCSPVCRGPVEVDADA